MTGLVVADSGALLNYDAACRALEQAKTIDEVKTIVGQADALRAYARQAKNRTIEIYGAIIRTRAERRLGEILVDLKLQKRLSMGGRLPSHGRRTTRKQITVSIRDLGLTAMQSMSAQRLAKISENKFEEQLVAFEQKAISSPEWRGLPLRQVKTPSRHRYLERQRNRKSIRPDDEFDGLRMLDGRLYGDVLFGELDRLIFSASAHLALLRSIRSRFANADHGTPLREMVTASALRKMAADAEIESLK